MHVHTIQLNIGRLLGGTTHMDATEFGAYVSLIIACYQSSNRLPKDDKRLSRMARVTPHKWARIKETVISKFEDKGDHFEQIFVKKELERIQSLSEKNRANALRRNETPEPVAQRSQSQNAANIRNKEQYSPTVVGETCHDYQFMDTSGTFLSWKGVVDRLWANYPRMGRRIRHKEKFNEQLTKLFDERKKNGTGYNDTLAWIETAIGRYAEYTSRSGEITPDPFRWVRDGGYDDDYNFTEKPQGQRGQCQNRGKGDPMDAVQLALEDQTRRTASTDSDNGHP